MRVEQQRETHGTRYWRCSRVAGAISDSTDHRPNLKHSCNYLKEDKTHV